MEGRGSLGAVAMSTSEFGAEMVAGFGGMSVKAHCSRWPQEEQSSSVGHRRWSSPAPGGAQLFLSCAAGHSTEAAGVALSDHEKRAGRRTPALRGVTRWIFSRA